MNREVIEAHLQSAGYEVIVAHSGEKALEIAYIHPLDLVLLDVRMYGMSGYEVCRRLKSHDATRLIPVMMVTALESNEDRVQAMNAGADDFICKPFDSLILLNRVRNLVSLKSLHDESKAHDE